MRWRPVVGYEGHYEVSDHGHVRSLDRHVLNRHGTLSFRKSAIMRQVMLDGRYPAVGLTKNGKQRVKKVHLMVAEAFIGPRPRGQVTRHLDGNGTNNYYKNLAWGTSQENSDDMQHHGTVVRGDQHGCSKLTAAKVRRIRKLLVKHTNAAVAEMFGMSNQQISNIKLRKSWAHVE